MSSSLGLMSVYTVMAFAMQALVVGVIIFIEPMLGSWSGIVFMTAYLLTFWAAWSLSVRLTEPKGKDIQAAQPSQA